jgi:hypothetical protein
MTFSTSTTSISPNCAGGAELASKRRRRAGLAASALLVSVATYGNALAATITPQAARTVVVEAANQTPTDTGITVKKGKRLVLKATGTWCLGGQPPTAECGGPEGIRAANPVELPLILNKAKIGKLIGRIGNGPWFGVGKLARITAKRNGRLVLMFNDRPCCFGDNSGFVSVEIRRPQN